MDTKLHAVTDSMGRPIRFFITAGQVSDHAGARALLDSLPSADCLPGDRGYDADRFREDLMDKGTAPCIPGRKSRDKPVRYDKRRYRRRSRIEIMFGRLKDWRRVATCHDRCPKVFLSAIALAATVFSGSRSMSLEPTADVSSGSPPTEFSSIRSSTLENLDRFAITAYSTSRSLLVTSSGPCRFLTMIRASCVPSEHSRRGVVARSRTWDSHREAKDIAGRDDDDRGGGGVRAA